MVAYGFSAHQPAGRYSLDQSYMVRSIKNILTVKFCCGCWNYMRYSAIFLTSTQGSPLHVPKENTSRYRETYHSNPHFLKPDALDQTAFECISSSQTLSLTPGNPHMLRNPKTYISPMYRHLTLKKLFKGTPSHEP